MIKEIKICEKHNIEMRADPIHCNCDCPYCEVITGYNYICPKCEAEAEAEYQETLKKNKKKINKMLKECMAVKDENDNYVLSHNGQSLVISWEMVKTCRIEEVTHRINRFLNYKKNNPVK